VARVGTGPGLQQGGSNQTLPAAAAEEVAHGKILCLQEFQAAQASDACGLLVLQLQHPTPNEEEAVA